MMGINKQQVVNLGSDIRYISTVSPRLMKKGAFLIGTPLFFIIIILILLLYFVADRLLKRYVRLKGDVRRTRNKKANKVARMRLKQAQVYMKENLHSPFYEELHKALLGYISDKLSIQFAEMQRDTIKEVLLEKGAAQEDISLFMTLLEDCEMARYSQSAGAGAMAEQYEKAMDTISNLENRL